MRPIPAHAFLAFAVLPLTVTGKEETLLEEVIVTASFVGVNESMATRPIHVVSGETLEQNGTQSGVNTLRACLLLPDSYGLSFVARVTE
jgi:hypothetical protein